MLNASSSGWTKICGVRDSQQAAAIARLRPSAIGLNFYSKSSRFVTDEQARSIAHAVQQVNAQSPGFPPVQLVGVFVNLPLEDLCHLVSRIPLDGVQFHGDESADEIAAFHARCPTLSLFRAYRVAPAQLQTAVDEIAALKTRGVTLAGCLLDAPSSQGYGGTGEVLPWDDLGAALRHFAQQGIVLPPVILAGGLRPSNVALARAKVHPAGLDVASGVESAPGVKDLSLVAEFLQAARTAI